MENHRQRYKNMSDLINAIVNFVRKVMDDYSDLGHILWVVFKSVFRLLLILAGVMLTALLVLLHFPTVIFVAFTIWFILMGMTMFQG